MVQRTPFCYSLLRRIRTPRRLITFPIFFSFLILLLLLSPLSPCYFAFFHIHAPLPPPPALTFSSSPTLPPLTPSFCSLSLNLHLLTVRLLLYFPSFFFFLLSFPFSFAIFFIYIQHIKNSPSKLKFLCGERCQTPPYLSACLFNQKFCLVGKFILPFLPFTFLLFKFFNEVCFLILC